MNSPILGNPLPVGYWRSFRSISMLKKISGVLVALAPLSAFAAVPVEVTTAMSDAKTDSLVVAGLALVVIIAIAAFKYMRRAV